MGATAVLVVAAVAAVAACGDATTTSDAPASVRVEPSFALLLGVGDTARFSARALDTAGREVRDPSFQWRVDGTGVAEVDGTGLVRGVGAGEATVVAGISGVEGSAGVETYVPRAVSDWQPGVSYFGRAGYVEYIPGELPLVISVPHGGRLEPAEIPDRTFGTTVTDRNTREMAFALREAFIERTGKAPHLILSHLRRTKLDPNRDVEEAAQGNPFAELAWEEFQGFIETACRTLMDTYGTGFYVDLHGHGHPVARIELGYLLGSDDLNRSDTFLDAPETAARSSIRALWHAADVGFAELVRGPASLGGRMADAGLRAVPSPEEPGPGSDPYFSGGYNTARHGSRVDGVGVSGVQIELPFPGYRDTESSRAATAAGIARAIEGFMTTHYGFFR